ncbi:hypothetical protein DFJ74DRAFT_771388 [Hyaloraphidium curvatum]|nr:hypothetical protein DFJ74DRAFT_771388 [Hyaloraphidium curvatum]
MAAARVAQVAAHVSAPSPGDNLPLALVDIAAFDPARDPAKAREIARRVLNASTETGFLYVKGHGVSKEALEGMFALAEEYYLGADFDTQKKPYTMGHEHIGYMGVGGQTLDPSGISDNKELFNFAKFVPGEPGSDRPLPEILDRKKALVERASREMHELGRRLLRIIALGMEIPESAGGHLYFDPMHAYPVPSGDTLRILHYPPESGTPGQPRSAAERGIRIGAHTDWGSVTCLFQDGTGGLQIQRPGGKWVDVPPVEGGCIVNLGDILQFWTQGYLRSTLHRVVPSPIPGNAERRRFSVGYFLRPGFDVPLSPIPSPMLGEDASGASRDAMAPADKVLTAGEWLRARTEKSFTKEGKLPSGY